MGTATSLSRAEAMRWRLHSLRLADPPRTGPAAVVEHLLAVQGEQVVPTTWALGTRCGAVREEVEAALDHDVLRTHLMRPTWHLARPDDVGWLQALGRDRLQPVYTRQLDAAGLGPDLRARLVGLVEQALVGGEHLVRSEVADALAAAGHPVTGQPLGVLMAYAETVGEVCSGVPRGDKREHTYALLDERAPTRRRLERSEALIELARRYVRSHGPVTDRDLAYWATLTLTDARAGLEGAGLHRVDVEGRPFWADGEPRTSDPVPRAHVLHLFDEVYRGVQDSRDLLDGDGLAVAGRETSLGLLLLDGALVGSVARSVTARCLRLEVTPWRRLRRDERDAVDEAAARYAAFLGREPDVRLVT